MLLNFSTLDIGAPKRKAGAGVGHYGLRDDAAAPLMIVVLSRLARARDDGILAPISATPIGVTLLSLLKAAVSRVAVSTGGADPSFNDQSTTSLFNLSASGIASMRIYDGGISLPSKLPWPKARALTLALLESLNSVRTTDLGGRVGILLMTLPALPVDAAVQSDLVALVANVEREMVARLGGAGSSAGGGAGGSNQSEASSSRSTPPPVPLLVDAIPINGVDATQSLSTNARVVIEGRLGRPLAALEIGQLDEALATALSVLQAGGDAARLKLLTDPMAISLLTPSAAWVWAAVTETAADGLATSLSTLLGEFVSTTSGIAGALFTSGLDL